MKQSVMALIMGLTTYASASNRFSFDPFNGENTDTVVGENRITQRMTRTKGERDTPTLRNAKVDKNHIPYEKKN